MTAIVTIAEVKIEKDSDGLMKPKDSPIINIRAYREFRRGTERWAHLAAFSEATCLFRFRKIPGIEVRPDMVILCDGLRYRIISAEDVRGKGMYLEALCCANEPTIY